MSITFKKFVPRPGLVNKQGRLPDPSELVCIEVPKIFDQCLIKRCLAFDPQHQEDTPTTDSGLRQKLAHTPKRFLTCRDFDIKLLSVEKIPIANKPGFKRVIITFEICFFADYLDTNNNIQSQPYKITRTEVIPKFYCPDSVAQISAKFGCSHEEDLDVDIVKVEMVAECLQGTIVRIGNDFFLDITLGFHLIVKCELIVQLLIPTYDYCPVPSPCEEDPIDNPCDRFENAPVPKFYPDQNLKPLFPDCDHDDDDDHDHDHDHDHD